MSEKFWIEIVLAATVPLVLLGVIIQRIKTGKGIGVRIIQFSGLVAGMPVLAILGMEKVLEPSAIGALFGAVLGYLFANIGEYDKTRTGKEE